MILPISAVNFRCIHMILHHHSRNSKFNTPKEYVIIKVCFAFFFISGLLIWKIRLEGRIESSATITEDLTQVSGSFYYCATVPYSLTD